MNATRVQSSRFKVQSAAALTRNELTFACLALAGFFMFCCFVSFAAEWQQYAVAADMAKGDLGGLGFQARLDDNEGWPRLAKEVQFDHGRHFDEWTFPHSSRVFSPVDFGMIEPIDGTEPELDESSRDWGGYRMSLIYRRVKGSTSLNPSKEPTLELVASRLFPGVLIKAESEGLVLFTGFKHIGTRIGDTTKAEIDKGAPWRRPVGYPIPAFAAARTAQGVEVRAIDDIGELPVAGLEKTWLLAWYGKQEFFSALYQGNFDISLGWGDGKQKWADAAEPADCPFLILVNSPLIAISKDDGAMGLRLEFLEERCAIVVLPLMGEYFPRVSETEKWEKGLPPEIIERCDWWAGHMQKFPIRVEEKYDYNQAGDEIVFTEQFHWEQFRESGAVAAPVPPFLATAFLEGFPMRFSVAPENPKLVTPAGSWLAVPGVESYTVTFKGFSRYAAKRAAPDGLEKAPERLRVELAAQVKKVVEAGHLAPWMRPKKNIWNAQYGTTHLMHGMPGETLSALAEALPLLEEPLRGEALACMKQDRLAYPPETTLPMQGGHGARRESYDLPEFFLVDKEKAGGGPDGMININAFYPDNFYVANKLVPAQSLYHLASYYAAGGDKQELLARWRAIRSVLEPYLQRMDWAGGCIPAFPENVRVGRYTSGPYRHPADKWYGCGGVVDVNNQFAAAVGLVRLARLAGDADAEAEGWGLLARAALARFALGKICGHLYNTGLLELPPYWDSQEQDLRIPCFIDDKGMSIMFKNQRFDSGLTPCRDMTPELGMFLRDYLKPETERYFQEYELQIPHWYLAWGEAAVDFECNVPWPQDGHQTFMAHAWVLGDPPQWLEAHLDLPWQPRGDLLYIHKLVETIRAYAQMGK